MFIEISYPLSSDIPVFPGVPGDEFIPHDSIDRGGECNTTIVHHFLHNGTHVDAPFHFDNNGKTIEKIPVENFCYSKPLVIKKNLQKGGLIQPEDLKAYSPSLYEADIILICTGYHALREDKKTYMDDFPSLSVDAAKLIRTELLNVKAVAIDTLSIENCVLGPKKKFIVHKTLLSGDAYSTRPLLIFEDVNIGSILRYKIKRIYAFPIRFAGLEAAPVAMTAEVF